MADLCIKMGVQAPGQDVNDVLKVLDYIAQNHSEAYKPLRMQAYARDMSDGAIGVLASMSIIIKFNDRAGQEKTVTEHVIDGLSRTVVDSQPAYDISFTPLAQQLVGIVYEQRDQKGDPSDRAAFIQKKAEELGL